MDAFKIEGFVLHRINRNHKTYNNMIQKSLQRSRQRFQRCIEIANKLNIILYLFILIHLTKSKGCKLLAIILKFNSISLLYKHLKWECSCQGVL